ncbi:heavy-metal-associated domain-containing protein [Piscinibacter sp.]|uniref:heavy-metal-associated domain-containing protein n=1 Tax=Piscinibacter sp. TaxID=1903157 RepID=UPI002C49D29B|nr:cation transporter [Albitalea sp.]HUG26302.1 cation transporter [Albitalea sp.]
MSTFKVKGRWSPGCWPSLEKVSGVSHAQIDFDKRTATITFDADKTTAAAPVKAISEAGYPSTVRK